MKWKIEELELPLKFSWALSRGATDKKTNFLVSVDRDGIIGRGEVAFNVRYGETKDAILLEFTRFKESLQGELDTLSDLNNFMQDLELSSSLRCGIEMAFVDLLSKMSDETIEKLLGLQVIQSVKTSFSLPVLAPEKIGDFFNEYNLSRFESLKIKLAGDGQDLDRLKSVFALSKQKVRLDANEGFEHSRDVLALLDQLPIERVEFIEQPMSSSKVEEYKMLRQSSPVPVILDESITDTRVTQVLAEQCHGINVKLMKSGGYLRAMAQIREAKSLGLKVMIGCMVETSLGITAAMRLCKGIDFIDLDGFMFLKNDPFSLAFEEKGRIIRNDLH